MNTSKEAKYLVNGIDPYDFKKESCGKATIYSKEVPWSTVTRVHFLFNFGAMHDKPGKEGTAHFLEHMLFTGNTLYKDKFEIDQFSKKYTLDSVHASTWLTNVSVYFRCLPEHIHKSLNGIYHMLRESNLKEEDVEKERSIITQEAWGRFINQKHLDYIKKERHNTYYDMPDRLRLPRPLGLPETIAKIDKNDLVEMRDLGITQSALSVIVTGVITPEILSAIQKTILSLPEGIPLRKIYTPEKLYPPIEPLWIYTREQMGLTDSKQSDVAISGTTLRSYPCTEGIRSVASCVLQEIVFKEIRHKNSWCYSVNVGFGKDQDSISGQFSTRVDPEHSLDVIKIMHDIINNFIKGEYKAEFEQEKQLLLDKRCAMELRTNDISDYASGELIFDDYIKDRKSSFDEINATTYKDLATFVSEIFKNGTKLTEVVLPNEYDPEKIKEEIKALNLR